MRIYDLFEITRPYVQKAIDPALMTYKEYMKTIDPTRKRHSSDSYDVDVEKLNSYQSIDKFPILVNTITRHGRVFEVRKRVIDRREEQFVKTDENGDIIKDENGNALFFSPEEVALIVPEDKRYWTDIAIIDKETNKIVAITEDEWGTLLVMTTREYRRFGFGTLLVKLVREEMPDRPSGGFTVAGENNLYRVWSRMVKSYAASGFYSHLVKAGKISAEKAKEIINYAETPKRHKDQNFNLNDPKYWLLLTDGAFYAVLYDRRLFDIDDPDSEDDYWINKHIIAMAELGNSASPLTIGMTYGPKKLQAFLIAVLMSIDPKSKFHLNNPEIMAQYPIKKVGDNYVAGRELVNWSDMAKIEQRVRKDKDPFDEYRYRIIEKAEYLAQSNNR